MRSRANIALGLLAGVVAVLATAVPVPVLALPLVGNAQTVVRNVLGVIDQAEQTIYVDSDVFQDEDIVTGPKSATRIVFKDGTNLEMGENSRLKLTKLVFDPDPAKSKVVVKAVVGVFRWTSGSLPHESYGISTPVATVGIRGTTLELIVSDSGLTTVSLSRGSIFVANLKGNGVLLKPGEATTILPPDADGSQDTPSLPGPLSAKLQSMLWSMTVAILMADPPGDIAPAAGGASTTPVSNPVPPSTTGNGGNNSNDVTPTGFTTPPPPNPSPPLITPPITSVPHVDKGGNTGGGPGGSTGGGPGGGTGGGPGGGTGGGPGGGTGGGPGGGTGGGPGGGTGGGPGGGTGGGPGGGTGGGPTGPVKTKVTTITIAATPVGKTRSIQLILVIPTTGAIDLAGAVILGDPHDAFSVVFPTGEQPTATTDSKGNPAEAFALEVSFTPPENANGPIIATLEIPDLANDPTQLFDITLSGEVAIVSEPGSLVLLLSGLGGLGWVRRRRRLRA